MDINGITTPLLADRLEMFRLLSEMLLGQFRAERVLVVILRPAPAVEVFPLHRLPDECPDDVLHALVVARDRHPVLALFQRPRVGPHVETLAYLWEVEEFLQAEEVRVGSVVKGVFERVGGVLVEGYAEVAFADRPVTVWTGGEPALV